MAETPAKKPDDSDQPRSVRIEFGLKGKGKPGPLKSRVNYTARSIPPAGADPQPGQAGPSQTSEEAGSPPPSRPDTPSPQNAPSTPGEMELRPSGEQAYESDNQDSVAAKQTHKKNIDEPESRLKKSSEPDSPEELEDRERSGSTEAVAKQSESTKQKPRQIEGQIPYSAGAQGSKWYKRLSRRQLFGGGALSIGLVSGFLLLNILSGPAKIVQMAQMLQGFHTSSVQSTGDHRFLSLARYIRSPDKPENLRLGFLGGRYAATIESRFRDMGIEARYTELLGYQDGYTIDPVRYARSQGIQDPSPGTVKNFIEKNEGVKVTREGGKLVIEGNQLGYFKFKKLTKSFLKSANLNNKLAPVQFRTIARKGGLTLHPIKIADRKLTMAVDQRLSKWWKDRAARINAREGGIQATSGATDTDTEEARNEAAARQAAANETIEGAKPAQEGLKEGKRGPLLRFQQNLGVRLFGGAAAGIGVLCIMRSLDDNADNIKQAQVVMPLMRMGTEIVAVGNQVMSNQDLTLEQVGYYNKLLEDSETGSTAFAARSIKDEQGRTGEGKPVSPTLTTITANSPFHFTNEGFIGGTLSGACSTVGQAVVTVVSFLGGPVSTIAGTVIGLAAGPYVVAEASKWIVGAAVDITEAGAPFGDNVNYGFKLATVHQAITFGGRALDKNEASEIRSVGRELDQEEFKSKGLAYKLFSPYDYRSFAAGLFRNHTDPMKGATDIASAVAKAPQMLLGIPGKLFSSKAAAQSPTAGTHDYGFPDHGFSVEELDNPETQNPYENSKRVLQLLEGADGGSYIDRAEKCFGMEIAKDADGRWGVKGAEGVPKLNEANSGECSEKNLNWLTIRFFIFDTQYMETYACYEALDEQACGNIGYGTTVTTPSEDAGTPAAGDAELLTTLNGHTLNANEAKRIKYIADSILPLLPGSPANKAAMAARVTWWSLKESVLKRDDVFRYSNCGGTYNTIVQPCSAGAWQVGIAAVQVANFSSRPEDVLAMARSLHPDQNPAGVLAELAKLAGLQEGSDEFNSVVSSTGIMRTSLLLRDPATGFVLVDDNVTSGCINKWDFYCDDGGPEAQKFAPNPTTAEEVRRTLENYFKKAATP